MSTHLSATELRNPRTHEIDTWPSERIIEALLDEDVNGVKAAAAVADALSYAVDQSVARISAGGKVHSFGAGASGRLAVLDATEVTPTFGAPVGLFSAHFPGGAAALTDSSIDLEDAEALGRDDAARITDRDIAVGVTASGSTAYVRGALSHAKKVGAMTVLICCNPKSKQQWKVDHFIAPDTGPEAITGSTRLKAGTATKVLLNAFSTTLMVRMGRAYSNLMVDLIATNEKLEKRAIAIVSEGAGIDVAEARQALSRASGSVPTALVHVLSGCSIDESLVALKHGGNVRAALRYLNGRCDD